MESKDIIPAIGAVIGAIVVILGWVFTKWKDRQHEIFKERLRRRMEMYDAVIAATLPFLNPINGVVIGAPDRLSALLGVARTHIGLYGYADEIEAFECFVRHVLNQDGKEANSALVILMPLIVGKLRAELGYRTGRR